MGNLTSINYPASPDVTLSYDPLNRLTNMVDAVGTTRYAYAAGGQLFTENGPWASDTVTNSYTKRLRTGLGLVQPTGYWTNGYKYDLAQRLTNIASVSGSFSFSYDAGAVTASPRVRKLTLPNSAYITNDFDSAGRLLFTRLLTSGGTVTNKHEYSYNLGSQRTNHLRHDDSYVRFTYDGIGQLKSGMATNASGSPLTSEHRGYAYDSAFNLCDRTNGTTAQTFYVNGKNELTNYASTTCKYDCNGNMTNNGNVYYGYDDENRLAEAWSTWWANRNLWWWSVFVYDGQSRLRVVREYRFEEDPPEFGEGPGSGGGTWVLNSETRYLYDGKLVIQERDVNNTPTVTYTRGTDLSGSREGAGGIGGLLARTANSQLPSTNAHAFYHADGNGNVTFLLANDQTLSARYTYDPYGRAVSSSGSLASANTYRFSSKEVHGRTGFSSYLYRSYAPEMQRWVNRDPINEPGFKATINNHHPFDLSAEQNLLAFVLNSPANSVDPTGLCSVTRPSCVIMWNGYTATPRGWTGGSCCYSASLQSIVPGGTCCPTAAGMGLQIGITITTVCVPKPCLAGCTFNTPCTVTSFRWKPKDPPYQREP